MIYEKKIKIRIAKFAVVSVIGIVALIIGLTMRISDGVSDFSTGYLTGTGAGLVGVSIACLIKNISALRNKDKQRAMKIEEEDERNLMLTYKAGYYTMLIATLGFYVFSFYFIFIDSIIFTTITSIISVMLFIFVMTYFILRKIR